MAKKVKKKAKKNRFLYIFLLISTIYLIKNIILLGPIEPLIRYISIGVIIIINILIFIKVFLSHKKKKNTSMTIFMLFFIVINIGLGYTVDILYSKLTNMTKTKTVYSTSLVVLKDSKYNLSSLNNKKICMIDDETSIDGYILANKLLSEKKLTQKNQIIKYDNYPTLINNLYEKECNAILIPSNYESLFQGIDEYKNIKNETISIAQKTENQKQEEKIFNTKKITEPFTMLLMGIDSSKDGLGNSDSFNGDSLMVVTFNPNTLNTTILSIPRDSYVPIACFKGKYENKITHAAWKGTNCVINTIQDFLDIKIDYYAKINFKGLVSLVNELGGITVEVPKDLCTDSSDRKGKVCIKKGKQKLNGEEALVLSRNRKQLANGDIDRGINQQVVLQGIIDSAKKINSASEIYRILDVVSKNLDTNMSNETILSFYDVGKTLLTKASSSTDLIGLQQLYLAGTGQMIYDENTHLTMWNYILNKQSVEDVSNEMKINLELKESELIKTFSYEINENYTKKIVGKGPYKIYTTYDLVPDLTKYSKIQAQNWANEYGITLIFNEVQKQGYANGRIISQQYPYRKRIDKIADKKISVQIVNNFSNLNNE